MRRGQKQEASVPLALQLKPGLLPCAGAQSKQDWIKGLLPDAVKPGGNLFLKEAEE